MNERKEDTNAPGKDKGSRVGGITEPEQSQLPLVDPLKEPPTWIQRLGGNLASRVLWFVCGLSVLFLIAWWFTRPTLAGVQKILGNSATPKDVLEILRSLQRDHFDRFRDLFQIVVLSGLVPLFTLLAGYAFGAREREKREQEGEE